MVVLHVAAEDTTSMSDTKSKVVQKILSTHLYHVYDCIGRQFLFGKTVDCLFGKIRSFLFVGRVDGHRHRLHI